MNDELKHAAISVLAILVLLLILLALRGHAQVELQQSFMVWDKTCITEIKMDEKLHLEAPMVDGKPDMTRARLFGVMTTYDPGCGRIEIRKVK